MHHPDNTAPDIEAIRAEAIRHAGIGIVVLHAAEDGLRIVDANDAFGILIGRDAEELAGTLFDQLYGPRTDMRRARSMDGAIRKGLTWKNTNVLQNMAGAPLPVQIDLAPKSWPNLDGKFAILTVIDATAFLRARNVQRLFNDISVIIGRTGDVEYQASRIAASIVRDFADWCVIHLRGPENKITMQAVASRRRQQPTGEAEVETDQYGIGKVIASGIPLLHQPSHRANAPLLRQVQDIIGEPVHAVASVPVAATSLEAFGAITWAITDDKREYHHEDVQAAEEAGSKFGHYLEESQIRESLARAVKARENFMKAAGHELRTPLVSIKGYTQMLLRDFRRQTISPQRLESGLKAIDTSTSRLTDLMEDMFAVSNPGRNNLPLRLATVDLNAYIQEFLNTTPSLSLAGHKFQHSSTHERLPVSIDLVRFSQVLFNIAINAVHFSPPESDVKIMTTRERDSVIISITDFGKGLASGEETAIFDPFAHAISWHDSDAHGLGIGLYISKQIVLRHKGTIWANSEGIDKGTTISIRLPLAADTAETA